MNIRSDDKDIFDFGKGIGISDFAKECFREMAANGWGYAIKFENEYQAEMGRYAQIYPPEHSKTVSFRSYWQWYKHGQKKTQEDFDAELKVIIERKMNDTNKTEN